MMLSANLFQNFYYIAANVILQEVLKDNLRNKDKCNMVNKINIKNIPLNPPV
jgi:hypothetical protein